MGTERTSATVKVDERGRCYIPQEVRRALGFHGQEAHVRLDIELLDVVGTEE